MKALFTISFVMDLPSDELAGVGEKLEVSAFESMRLVAESSGVSLEDIASIFEFYGCAVTVQKELESA